MKKIIIGLLFASFLIPGIGNINPDVRAEAEETKTEANYYSKYLDKDGNLLSSKIEFTTFTPDSHLSPYAMNYACDDYFIDGLIEEERITNYYKIGDTVPYPVESDTGLTMTNNMIHHNVLWDPVNDIEISDGVIKHQYFILPTVSFDTLLTFRDTSKYVSLAFESNDDPYGEYEKNGKLTGYKAIVHYLNQVLNNGEEVPLLIINENVVAKFVKRNDKIVIQSKGAYVYFDESMKNVYIDIVNPGFISNIQFLTIDFFDNREPYFDLFVKCTKDTFDNVYIYTPFFIQDYDHHKGILTLVYSRAGGTWSEFDSISSITIDGFEKTNLELLSTDNEACYEYHTYKINYGKEKDTTTHDVLISDLIVSDGTEEKSIPNLTASFRYFNQDIHHTLAVDAHVDYWFAYSKIWFTLNDLEYKCRILNNMADITFAYYELDKEWEKDNSADLIRGVYHNREESLESVFNVAAQKLYPGKDYYDLTYVEKYKVMTSIDNTKEEFSDKYGRYWKLQYVKGNAGNRIEQEWSGVQGGHHDWELYTNKPANLVYWDPHLSVVFVSYTSEAGETIKTSSYKDGVYAEMIDGEWVIKDVRGNVYENYSVNDDGLIMDEEGNPLKSPTTTTSEDWIDKFIGGVEDAIAKLTSPDMLKKILGITIGVLVVVGVGYIAYEYIKNKYLFDAIASGGRSSKEDEVIKPAKPVTGKKKKKGKKK